MTCVRPWIGLAAIVCLMTPFASATAGEALALATGRADEPAFRAGVGLSSLVKFDLLPRDQIDLQAVKSEGAIDNVRLLHDGDAQLAILPSVVGYAARKGIGSFAGKTPESGLRAITMLWREAVHLIIREEDVLTGTADDFLRLENRRVFLGRAASGMADANRLLLSHLGVDVDQTFAVVSLPDGDAAAALKRGEVDALSAVASPPLPMFDQIFNGTSPAMKLLDMTEPQMTRANGSHWLWTPYVIPAATYPGQNEDVWTIALSNILVTRADVADDVVYAITKSIYQNLPYLRRVDPVLADLAIERALDGMSMPLHPGALRYYQDVGLVPTEVSQPAPVNRDLPTGGYESGYPNADVAGDLPLGAGGPLTPAESFDQTPRPAGPSPAEPALQDQEEPDTAPWRQRAVL